MARSGLDFPLHQPGRDFFGALGFWVALGESSIYQGTLELEIAICNSLLGGERKYQMF